MGKIISAKNIILLLFISILFACKTIKQTNAIQTKNESQKGVYKLTPLDTGYCTLGERHLLGDEFDDNNRVPIVLYAFLFESIDGKEKGLVDLGPKTVEYTNDMFQRFGFFRKSYANINNPDDIVQRYGNVFDHLERLHIIPKQIEHIIFTHLHADHHGMDNGKNPGSPADFPNVIFYVSGKGWEHNLSKKQGWDWHSYLDHQFANFLQEKATEGKVVFKDDYSPLPGISIGYLGGHSVCSQMICVNTEFGLAILTSDEIYTYNLFKQAKVPRLKTTNEQILAAWDKIVKLSDENDSIILPVHEPVLSDLYQKYGDNWLLEAKKISKESLEQYKQSKRTLVGE